MNTHVNKFCSAAFFHLFIIKRICKYLSKETTEKLVHAFFFNDIDYCNCLLYGLLVKQLDKMQRLQDSAARLPKFCQIAPVLVDLHWLPVKYRIDFKIGLARSYISDLISVKENKYHLRSSDTEYAENNKKDTRR